MSPLMSAVINPFKLHLPFNEFPRFIDLNLHSPYFWNPSRELHDEVEKSKERADLLDQHSIFLVPNHPVISSRLVRPLVLSKYHHICGDFLSSIALSGLACEMCTFLIYEAYLEVVGEDGYDDEFRRLLVERKYERWGQDRRLEGLQRFEGVPESFAPTAKRVAGRRNKYLHALRLNEAGAETDSKENFMDSLAAIKDIVEATASNEPGAVQLKLPVLRRFLEIHQVIRGE